MDADIKREFETPRQIILCQEIKYGYFCTMQWREGWSMEDYVQLSEPVPITFTPLTDDTVIQNAVAAYEAQEKAVLADCNRQVMEIREKKARLLSLTHQSEPTL